jgi:hypothetical protein
MSVSDWKRTTKEVPLEALRPEIATAIQKHIEQYNLGSVLSEVLMCVQTDSEKAKKGLFGRAETVSVSVWLTPRWLMWAIRGSDELATVFSAQLRDIVVQDYAQTQFAKMIPDIGIEVSGRFTDATESASAFIGLDDGLAGNKFRELLIQAVQEAKE